jgi:hypothetical protein
MDVQRSLAAAVSNMRRRVRRDSSRSTPSSRYGRWHVCFIGTGMLRLTEPRNDRIIAYHRELFHRAEVNEKECIL